MFSSRAIDYKTRGNAKGRRTDDSHDSQLEAAMPKVYILSVESRIQLISSCTWPD